MENGSYSLGRGSKHFLRNIWSVFRSCETSWENPISSRAYLLRLPERQDIEIPFCLPPYQDSTRTCSPLRRQSAVTCRELWRRPLRLNLARLSHIAYCVSRRASGCYLILEGVTPRRLTTYPATSLYHTPPVAFPPSISVYSKIVFRLIVDTVLLLPSSRSRTCYLDFVSYDGKVRYKGTKRSNMRII